MFDAILNNRLVLAAVIFLLLLMVPALVLVRGHKLREPWRPDRRKSVRIGRDRRA